jgi:hypothetical protein
MRWGTLFFLTFLFITTTQLKAQSVALSNGKWAKLAVSKQGIYQVSGTQLKTWGFSLPISSSQLQLFNLNNAFLVERNSSNQPVGLFENAIQIQDGGDGQFDAPDYFLFYSEGAVSWKWDATTNSYQASKPALGDSVYYFLTIGKEGKRIQKVNNNFLSLQNVDDMQERILFEKDSLNILNTGKLWVGAPLGAGLGKSPKVSFNFNAEGLLLGTSLKWSLRYAAAATQFSSNFELRLNDVLQKSTLVPAISGFVYDDAFNIVKDTFQVAVGSNLQNTNLSNAVLGINFSNNNANATGWIDQIQLEFKRKINFNSSKTFGFRNAEVGGLGKNIQYQIGNADASVKIWDVTYPEKPIELGFQLQNTNASIQQSGDTLHEFFAVKQQAYEIPNLSEILTVEAPSLLYTPAADYIIISASNYLPYADSLAKFHNIAHGLKTFTTSSARVFNEFGGGQPTPIAIRNYIKYLFQQAAKNKINPPQYLLLWGLGNFDLKKTNHQFQLPAYESEASNSILSSYTSDDFFAIINDNDDINFPNAIQNLALSVGRIPARTIAEADTALRKIIQYQLGKNVGSWCNQLTWVADDGDYNLHLQHAEEITNGLKLKQPQWNSKKLYLDLFPAVNSAGGNTYPLVNTALKQMMNNGSLLLNYTGHGNYTRLAEEAVITQEDIQQWDNADKLPLMVTASCDFAPFDQPQLQPIGQDALLKNKKGIIGLVAASRLVFAYINKEINNEFIQQLLVPDSLGNYKTIGASLRNAKMSHWKKGGDHLNAFKFNLLGDPAMTLAKPSYQVIIDKLNQKIFLGKDTLKAGGKYQLTGHIGYSQQTLSSFEGVVEFTLWDAPKTQKTLANTSMSMVTDVLIQENILFKGKASVSKGVFSIDFILPKEVTLKQGTCRMQLYAATLLSDKDALGVYDSLWVNDYSSNVSTDTTGPQFVHVFMNDTLNEYKKGTWILPNTTLYLKLADSSGIQASGNSLGHDLSLVIDGAVNTPILLNNYFSADVNTYQKGSVTYTLPKLTEGAHQFIIKAWDLIGNSSKDTIDVVVPNEQNIVIRNLTNYPNPVLQSTRFSFEISQTKILDKNLSFSLDIFNQQGTRVATKNFDYPPAYNRTVIADFEEIGALQAGVYFYKLTLKNSYPVLTATNKFIKY